MKEVFIEVPQFPDYEVSNLGRVKTKSRMIRFTHSVTGKEHFRKSEERYLKIHYNNLSGYKFCQLYFNKKMYNKTIHRLVASAFLPNENSFECVNHIDGNKHNNISENLEWCTNEYNHKHATETGLKAKGEEIGRSVLKENSVIAIKKMILDGITHSKIAFYFGVSRTTITLINTGSIWKHIK